MCYNTEIVKIQSRHRRWVNENQWAHRSYSLLLSDTCTTFSAPKKLQRQLQRALPFLPIEEYYAKKTVLYVQHTLHLAKYFWGTENVKCETSIWLVFRAIQHNTDKNTWSKNSDRSTGRLVGVVAAFQSFSYKHPREAENVGSLYISNTGTLCTRRRSVVTPFLFASTEFLPIKWNVSPPIRNRGKESFIWEPSLVPEYE